MNKVKLIVDVAQQVLKVVEDLRSLSDSVQVVCNTVLEGLSEEPKAKALPEKKEEPTNSKIAFCDKSTSDTAVNVKEKKCKINYA